MPAAAPCWCGRLLEQSTAVQHGAQSVGTTLCYSWPSRSRCRVKAEAQQEPCATVSWRRCSSAGSPAPGGLLQGRTLSHMHIFVGVPGWVFVSASSQRHSKQPLWPLQLQELCSPGNPPPPTMRRQQVRALLMRGDYRCYCVSPQPPSPLLLYPTVVLNGISNQLRDMPRRAGTPSHQFVTHWPRRKKSVSLREDAAAGVGPGRRWRC